MTDMNPPQTPQEREEAEDRALEAVKAELREEMAHREDERLHCISAIESLLDELHKTNNHHSRRLEPYLQWRGRVLGLEAALNVLQTRSQADAKKMIWINC